MSAGSGAVTLGWIAFALSMAASAVWYLGGMASAAYRAGVDV